MLITAHRGASGLAPENTLSAIHLALAQGADCCEIDIQETADGVVVLLHDDNLKKTTGIHRNIWEVTYAEIKQLDAGAWFDPKFKGEPIPTLEQVLAAVPGRMKLNIELKINGHEKHLIESAIAILERSDFIKDCVLTSFDFAAVQSVRQINSAIRIGYIFSTNPPESIFQADCELLSVHKKLATQALIQKAHAHQKQVHVWTVNEPDEMQRFIELGVDSIITNWPGRLRALLT